MTRVRTVRRRPYVQFRLRGVRVNTTGHARLALSELEASLRVDDDAWLLSERGEDRRLALDPHVLPMDELRRDSRIKLLTRRRLRLTAEQERIASVIEANPASLVTVRVNGRERELTNHHEGADLSVGLPRLLLGGWSSSVRAKETCAGCCQRTGRGKLSIWRYALFICEQPLKGTQSFKG